MPSGLEILALAAAPAGAAALTRWRAARNERAAEAAHPPMGRLIELDQGQVHAWVAGTGPDLVLIHGSSGNLRDFTLSLAPRLAERYRVIALDRPGLGYSAAIGRGGASIAEQAEHLARACAELGARRPLVLGQSYGGAVALAWAVHHPERIAGLIAVAPAAMPWTTPLSRYYKLTSHPVAGPLVIPFITAWVRPRHIDEGVAEVFLPQATPPGYAAHFGPGLTLRRSAIREQALQRRNLLAEITALAPRYPDIAVPTEILHGEADTTVGIAIHSEPLAQAIPGAVLTRLPGIGHMPHHAAPEAVIAAVDRAATRAGLR